MFGFPAVAACMPAHDEALNERSLMPPVSVTMQPRNLPVAAAELLEPAAALDELLVPPPDAEVWLLPHAAMTTVADTASAAVAHALCLTLTSTGPARGTRLASHSSWVVPQVMPGDPRWEGDTRLSGALVAESEPGEDGSPGLSDRDPGSVPGILGAFLHTQSGWRRVVGRSGRGGHAGELEDGGQPAAWRLRQPGRAAVR